MRTVLLAHRTKLEEMRSRANYKLGLAILFSQIVILVLHPFAANRKSRTIFADDGAIGRTNQFLLDLCLPPDRAEEYSTALQDACERKWEKRYSPREVALFCFVQTHQRNLCVSCWPNFQIWRFILGHCRIEKSLCQALGTMRRRIDYYNVGEAQVACLCESDGVMG
jgi:hypothetical protein